MKTIMYVTVAIVLLTLTANATDVLPIEGRLLNADGTPIEAQAVSFRLEVLDPSANECVLYHETQGPIDMTGSNGYFSLSLGTGARNSSSAFQDTSSIFGVFNNNSSNMAGLTCGTNSSGTEYVSSPNDGRKIRISFDDSNDGVENFETLSQLVEVGAAPYANYAKSLQGFEPSDFIKVKAGTDVNQAALELIFAAPADTTKLRSLLDDDVQYLPAEPNAPVDFNNQRIVNVAAPTSADHVVNRGYADTTIAGTAANLGTLGVGQTGEVLQWDGSKWVTTAIAAGDVSQGGNSYAATMVLGTNDSFNLAFKTAGTTRMTIDNTGGVAFTGGLGVATGINSGGNIQVQGQADVRFGDANNSNYVGLQAPADVAADLVWTLPAADGNTGQVLRTDGSGNLSWMDDNNSGGDLNNNGNAGAIVVGSNNSTLALKSADTTALSFDVSQNATFAADILGNQVDLQAESELRFQDNTGGQYVGLKAPAVVNTSYTLTLPTDDGTSGQVLKRDGSGNLVWGNDNDSAAAESDDLDSVIGRGNATTLDMQLSDEAEIRLQDGSGGEYAAIKAPNDITTTYTLTLPADDGSAGQVLVGDGAGVLTWTNIGGGGDFFANGSVPMSGNLNIQAENEIRLQDAAGGQYMGFKAPATVTSSTTLTLPDGDGSAGQVLRTDGAGVLSWVNDNDSGGDLNNGGNAGAIVVGSNNSTLALKSADTTALSFDVSQNATFAADILGNQVDLQAESELRFQDGADGEYVGFKAPNTVNSSYTLTLPADAGTNGQVLKRDGSGNLVWSNDNDSAAAESDTLQSVVARGSASTIAMQLNNETALQFGDGDTNYVSLQAPNNAAADLAFVLPAADGSANYVMVTDGSGNLSFAQEADPRLLTLTSAEVNQLENIDAATISATQWGYLGALGSAPLTGESDDLEAVIGRGNATTLDMQLSDEAEIRLQDGSGGEYAAIKAPNDITTTYTLTLPADDGSAGQVLRTDGAGVLSWVNDNDSGGDLNNGGNAGAIVVGSNNSTLALKSADTTALSFDVSQNATFAADILGNQVDLQAESELRFQDGAGGQYVGFKAPNTVSVSYTLTLPAADGAAGQVLKRDGSGNLVWSSDNDSAAAESDTLQSVVARGSASTIALQLNNETALQFGDSDTNYVSLQAPANAAADLAFVLPAADGSANYVMVTDGSGNLSFAQEADPKMQTLDADEVDQLENIGAATISATQWGYLGALGSAPLTGESDDLEAVIGRGNATTLDMQLNNQSDLRFGDDDGSNYAAIQAPATVVSNYTLTLPAVLGATGQVLQTNGSGLLSWVTPPTGVANLDGLSDVNTSFGTSNMFLGISSGGTATGIGNIGLGGGSLGSLTGGARNIAIGYQALNAVDGGNDNVAIGYRALKLSTTSSTNVAVGSEAGFEMTTGTGNTLLGFQAGSSLTSGSNNIIIGKQAQAPSPTDNYKLNIGNTIYGDLNTGKVGIGTNAPNDKLHVAGGGVTVTGGQATVVAHNNGASATFNFNNGNMQYTSADCDGTNWDLNNMRDGGSYTIVVRGTGTGTVACTFTHTGVTEFKYIGGNRVRVASTHTMYNFVMMGTYVYVSIATGL